MIDRIVVGYLSTNSYIFSEWKKECILVDPGGDAEKIIKQINLINLKPRGIVLTHGHLDHIAAVGDLVDHFTSRGLTVPIAIHKDDKEYMGDTARETHKTSFSTMGSEGEELFWKLFDPLPQADVLLEDGDTVFDSSLKVIHTPGHTPGSICLYSESQSLLFSGDTLFFEGIGRTDLPGGSAEALYKSLHEKVFTLNSQTRVFPGHGPHSTMEREKLHNPYAQVLK